MVWDGKLSATYNTKTLLLFQFIERFNHLRLLLRRERVKLAVQINAEPPSRPFEKTNVTQEAQIDFTGNRVLRWMTIGEHYFSLADKLVSGMKPIVTVRNSASFRPSFLARTSICRLA